MDLNDFIARLLLLQRQMVEEDRPFVNVTVNGRHVAGITLQDDGSGCDNLDVNIRPEPL